VSLRLLYLDLRPALRQAGHARPVIGFQGRRAASAAARGRRAAPLHPRHRLRWHRHLVTATRPTRTERDGLRSAPGPPRWSSGSPPRITADRYPDAAVAAHGLRPCRPQIQAVGAGRLMPRSLAGCSQTCPCPATMTWPGMGDFRLG